VLFRSLDLSKVVFGALQHPLPACLLAFHWPEEAIKPLSIVDTNKARLHKRGTQSATRSVLFHSVAFALTWISVTTGHPLRRASLAFISRNAHYRLSSPLATRHSPPYSSSKSQRSLLNLTGSHWVDEESKKHPCVNRNNEVCLAGDRCRGWTTGSQPFFRSCGGDRSSRGIVRTSSQ